LNTKPKEIKTTKIKDFLYKIIYIEKLNRKVYSKICLQYKTRECLHKSIKYTTQTKTYNNKNK